MYLKEHYQHSNDLLGPRGVDHQVSVPICRVTTTYCLLEVYIYFEIRKTRGDSNLGDQKAPRRDILRKHL